MIQQGKGSKDRMVPIGESACAWIDKYLREVRPELQAGADDYTLFLHDDGKRFPPGRLGDLEHAGVRHPGACHVFRHAMARTCSRTHPLLQVILGHADLATTQIWMLQSPELPSLRSF